MQQTLTQMAVHGLFEESHIDFEAALRVGAVHAATVAATSVQSAVSSVGVVVSDVAAFFADVVAT